MTRASRTSRSVLVALWTFTITLLCSSVAFADATPYFRVGSFDSGASVLGVAVDQSSNDVYVDTSGTLSSVARFGSAGQSPSLVVSAFLPPSPYSGVAVDPVDDDVYAYNSNGPDIETYDPTKSAGANKVGSFPVAGPSGALVQIASDSEGDVYYPNQTTNTVQEFDSGGTLVNTFAGTGTTGEFTKPQSVAVDSLGDVFVVDAGRVVEIAGSNGQANPGGGESVLDSGDSQDVAVDPVTNDVFVLDLSGMSCGSLALPCYHVVGYESDGTGFADFGAGAIANNGADNPPNHLAVDDATGNVYVSDYRNAVEIFSPHAPPSATTSQVSDLGATSATLNGTVNPNGTDTKYFFEYGLTTTYGQDSPAAPGADAGAGSANVPVSATVNGLQPNQTYHFQLVASSAGGTASGGDQTVKTNAAPPSVSSEASSNVTQTGALLAAQVNPDNEDTHYYIEQGTSELGACPASPAQVGSDIGSTFGAKSVSQLFGGLGPSTIYHYRTVAYNAAGVTCGPDQTFETSLPAQQGAPRAFELVSTDPGTPQDLTHDQWMAGLSPDGRTVFLRAMRDKANEFFSATRTPTGWQMLAQPTGASGPQTLFGGSNAGAAFFTGDNGSSAAVPPTFVYADSDGGLAPVSHDQTGALADVSRVAFGSNSPGCVACAISGAGTHFVFQVTRALTAGANASVANVYESDSQGHLTLVSVPSAGDSAPPTAAGAGLGANGSSGFQAVNFPNAISADGSRVFFSSTEQLDPSMPDDGQLHLYLRDLATETTTLVSKSRVPGSQADSIVAGVSSKDVTSGGATPDGSEAFFLSTDQLTTDAPTANGTAHLYEYNAGSGLLSYVARAADRSASTGKQAFVAVSDDGSRVFFTDTAQLTPDAPADSSPKLYVRNLAAGGGTQFIAELSPNPAQLQVSDDGTVVLFSTSADLTPDATGSQQHVYEWRADSGLSLISKGTSGQSGVIGAVVPVSSPFFSGEYDEGGSAGYATSFGGSPTTNEYGSPSLSSDGDWAFFSSQDRLTPDASSAPVWKIYGYHDGELSLVSPANSGMDAFFMGASPDGTDAYFQTRQPLAPEPKTLNGSMQLYDARMGGGFAAVSSAANPCPNNACDAPEPAAPAPAASINFAGPGNLTSLPTSHTAKVKLAKKSVSGSSFTLSVKIPAAGRITITGAGAKTLRKSVTKAGTYRLHDTITTKEKRLLRRKRKLKLKLRIAYTPRTGTSSTAAVALTMRAVKGR